eukprot:254123_1
METEGGQGLTLEVVAMSDIEEGEEVFVDYGKDFEEAWYHHVRHWKSPYETGSNDEIWISAEERNDKLGPLQIAPDFSEKYMSTDDRGILFAGCLYYEDDEGFWDDFQNSDADTKNLSTEEIISKYGYDYGHVYHMDNRDARTYGYHWPCVVGGIEPKTETEQEDAYIVRILQSTMESQTLWDEKSLPRIIRHFPRSSIRHFYLPYKSDIHLPHAFRHHIGLGDDIFPEIWKDRQN